MFVEQSDDHLGEINVQIRARDRDDYSAGSTQLGNLT
jgi:hypothetical protein